ncbi:hypothetical protein [Blastococcus sp. Marseille-P5729]|uniref:hypothetical protein n=1 Tax=Blastococcus sp. Marseille-P5729 TaxID=2086582 RepID=UPI000D0E8AF7|nr:hypothetical protein [Blastococcus sp. Marseille-P5729]
MLIDCNSCQAKPSACGDCVMSVLLEADPMGVELEDAEALALDALAGEGLVPPLRMVPLYPSESEQRRARWVG